MFEILNSYFSYYLNQKLKNQQKTQEQRKKLLYIIFNRKKELNMLKITLIALIFICLDTSAATTNLLLTTPTAAASPIQHSYQVSVGNIADASFQDIKEFETDVEGKARNLLYTFPDLKSLSIVDLNTDKIRATFTGIENQKIQLLVTDLDLIVKGKVYVSGALKYLCSTSEITIKLQDVAARAIYNYYSGSIESLNVDYKNKSSASCDSGVLSIPGVRDIISNFGSSMAKAKIDDFIRDELRNNVDLSQFDDLFGLEKVLANPSVKANINIAENVLGIDIDDNISNLMLGRNISIAFLRNYNGLNHHLVHLDVFQSRPKISVSNGQYYASAPGAVAYEKYAYKNGSWVRSSWTKGVLYNGQKIGVIGFNIYGEPSYLSTAIVSGGSCGKACF